MEYFEYLKLFKFRYHLSFFLVIIGAYLFYSGLILALIKSLIFLYISFNLLLYGGLYTLNDISDIRADLKHPRKKNRPISSGRISIMSAYFFAFFSIFLGLATGYFLFGTTIFVMYLLFVIANQFYTKVAKKIPYWEIFFNALTYPMRLQLGIYLTTDNLPILLLTAVLLLALGIACLRRTMELKSGNIQARPVLQNYSLGTLKLLAWIVLGLIVLASSVDYPHYAFWYFLIIAVYLISSLGIYHSKVINNFFQWLWLQ